MSLDYSTALVHAQRSEEQDCRQLLGPSNQPFKTVTAEAYAQLEVGCAGGCREGLRRRLVAASCTGSCVTFPSTIMVVAFSARPDGCTGCALLYHCSFSSV
jgi:hypothetical protein